MRTRGNKRWPACLLLLWTGFVGAALPIGEATPLFDLGEEGSGSLSLPSDVVVVDRRVYVVDGGHRRVAVFAAGGRFLFDMGRDLLEAPVGIGRDGQGRLYVADRGRNRIEVFSTDGRHLRGIALRHGDGSPARPIDVAVEADGRRLYVTTNDRHSLLTVDARGGFSGEWGENGAEEGEFRFPATLVLLAGGRLAITDVLNTRIQVFERSGRFLSLVGRWGVTPGRLFRPKGLAVDAKGRLLVSDSYLGVIQVFRDDGHFLHVLGQGVEPHRLGTPVGMDVDERGRLYVVRMREHRVSVFRLEY